MDQQASHALVAVFLNRGRAVFQVAVHEVTGPVGLCSCGLSVPAPVWVFCDFLAKVFCFGDVFQDLSVEGVVTVDLLLSSLRHSGHGIY